jgi:hypothetical protein
MALTVCAPIERLSFACWSAVLQCVAEPSLVLQCLAYIKLLLQQLVYQMNV